MNRLVLLIVALLAQPLLAGLWDSDRPQDPPEPYDVIGGRFDAYPEEYYRLRLDRVQPRLSALDSIEGSPDAAEVKLIADTAPLFDEASIALFRTGRFADAIILIDRKNQLLELIRQERTATASEHRTRALSNKAACLQHRWLSSDSPNMADLELAAEILRGLKNEDEYNADAVWSLREVEWLLDLPGFVPGTDPIFPNLLGLKDVDFRGTRDRNALLSVGLGGCLSWLGRRISYEAGWHDVDLMYAYSLALYLAGQTEESLFAWFRVCELIDEGQKTRVSNAPAPTALKRMLGVHLEDVKEQSEANRLYRELREQCDRWRNSREEFLLAGIQQGRHPDTHDNFWAGWSLNDDGPPEPGRHEPEDGVGISRILLLGGFGGLLLVLLLIFGAAMFMSRKGPAPSVDEL